MERSGLQIKNVQFWGIFVCCEEFVQDDRKLGVIFSKKENFVASFLQIFFVCVMQRIIQSNLDLVRKIFGPFNKKTFKIDLDIVRTSILCEIFSVSSIALY